MKARLTTFNWSHRALISDTIIFAVLTASALIVRWNLSYAAYNLWNVGCYVNIADLVMKKHTFYDPSWRLGMFANLNPLFSLLLGLFSFMAGKTPWDVYSPFLASIWSFAPFSVYYLTSRLVSWRAGLIAGIVAVYPLNLPDQGPWILSMVFAPFAVLYFLSLLEMPRPKLAVMLGLMVSLVFWAHMGTFLFLALTFSIFVSILLGIRLLEAIYGRAQGTPLKDIHFLHESLKTIRSLLYSVIVFVSLNVVWLVSAIELYGLEAFNAPLIGLSREEALLESWVIYLVRKKYPLLLDIALLASVFIIFFLIFRCIRGHCKRWTAQLYFIMASIVSYVLLDPFQTFGIWFGPPYRYLIYLAFTSEVIFGILFDTLFDELRHLFKSETDLICILLCGALLLSLTYTTTIAYTDALSRREIPGVNPFQLPIKDSEAHIKAMLWLGSIAKSSDIVAAEAPLSDRLRYFANVSTLSGFHYSTYIEPEKDEATAVILYSEDFNDTVAMLRRYAVRYVYATTETVGTYEIMVRWNNIWREKANLAKLYALLGDPVYEEDGILIFRVPEDLRLHTISLPLKIDVKNRTIFGEDFKDLEGWTFGHEGVEDRSHSLNNTFEIAFTSKGTDTEYVYTEYSLPRDEAPFIGKRTILGVKYKIGNFSHVFAGPKLLISLYVNGSWQDFPLHSEDWTTSYIHLSKFNVKGRLQAVRVGIWGYLLPQGRYKVYIDSLSIAEATIIEA